MRVDSMSRQHSTPVIATFVAVAVAWQVQCVVLCAAFTCPAGPTEAMDHGGHLDPTPCHREEPGGEQEQDPCAPPDFVTRIRAESKKSVEPLSDTPVAVPSPVLVRAAQQSRRTNPVAVVSRSPARLGIEYDTIVLLI